MLERRRHAPVGGLRRTIPHARPRGLQHVYAVGKRRQLPDLYTTDSEESRRGGRFRWFFSTCLAAAVGGVAIIVVIFGAADPNEGRGGVLPTLRRLGEQTRLAQEPAVSPIPGMKWALPKSDRLQATTGAASTRFIIQEATRQRRGNREYIHNKPYARIVARLGAVSVKSASQIPPFNPFRLYASEGSVGDASGDEDETGVRSSGEIALRVVELLGSILPSEDGQELDQQEVADLIYRAQEAQREEAGMKPGFLPEGIELTQASGARLPEPVPPYTSVLEKTGLEAEDAADDLEGREVRKVKVGRGDTLAKLLQTAGADAWLVRSMIEAARGVFPESALAAGQSIEFVMVSSLTRTNRLEPLRFAIFEGAEHKVTVSRSPAGEFVASTAAVGEPVVRFSGAAAGHQAATSLYLSLYQAALSQGLSPEIIDQILRVHAYETDFRRRARISDTLELFFDVKEEDRGTESPPGELLFTAITAGGDTQRYYRFRTPDGHIDYYDEYGNNSRKFLMRRPVRSDDARLASGFGVRFHPLLNTRKMHTGIDWAAASGTPVLASGTGVIEEIGPKGQYGNYIRIRHANGYQTAYGHMSRFAPGVKEGTKVRQGQVIGFVGNTGFSTGPHLHYEVLVNSRFVDPLSIQVPQERKLTGRQLNDFQKERSRLDDLMRRPPVRVAQVDSR